MAKLTAAQRRALPTSAFAGPGRSYPINDANHARAALSRASQFASPGARTKIKAKVHKRYPTIGRGTPSRKDRHAALAHYMRQQG